MKEFIICLFVGVISLIIGCFLNYCLHLGVALGAAFSLGILYGYERGDKLFED